MGASGKTLAQLSNLAKTGLLPAGASIADIGTQNLRCAPGEVIAFGRAFGTDISQDEAAEIAAGGYLGTVLKKVGFKYTAFDIFEAPDTVVLDLNRNLVPANAVAQFDLVANYGTTEHVINQMLSMRTIHDLAKPGGIIHHDLPFGGYHTHCYFTYNIGLFHDLAAANDYEVVVQQVSAGAWKATPEPLLNLGFVEKKFRDYGVEIVFRKKTGRDFSVPVDNSSSATISDAAWRGDPAVSVSTVMPVDAAMLFARLPFRTVHKAYWMRVRDAIRGRRLRANSL